MHFEEAPPFLHPEKEVSAREKSKGTEMVEDALPDYCQENLTLKYYLIVIVDTYYVII